MEIQVDKINSFHLNDEQQSPIDNTETTMEIPINQKMLNDVLDDKCYNDLRCEAATWKRVGFRQAETKPEDHRYTSEVLKCMRCQKLMLRHVVRE